MLLPTLPWLTRRPIAHRGLHDGTKGRVENCRQSFDAAINQDFAIELDVQITKDGKAVVFHDYHVDRLTHGAGRVDGMTLEALESLSFKQGSDHMEDLASVLAHVKGRVPMVIELKAPAIDNGQLEAAVAACLESYKGDAAMMSFSPKLVKSLKKSTNRPVGIVSCDYDKHKIGQDLSQETRYQLTHLLHVAETNPDFISYCFSDFPAPSVDLLKVLQGLPVICWAPKSVEDHKAAMAYCEQVTFEGYDPDRL